MVLNLQVQDLSGVSSDLFYFKQINFKTVRITFLLTVLFCLGSFFIVNAQIVSDLDEAITAVHNKMQAVDEEFTNNYLSRNPAPESFAKHPELFDLLIEKGDLIWKKYKTSPNVNTLIQGFKTFVAGVRGLEVAAQSDNSRSREIARLKHTHIFEGCIRSTLEGYNMSNGKPMFEQALTLMERYDRLSDYLAESGSVNILEKEELPTLVQYNEYLRKHNMAMIEYFVGHQMIYTAIVWPDGISQLQVNDKQKLLDNIRKLQSSMDEVPPKDVDMVAQNHNDFTSSASVISQMLFNYAANTIPDSISSIVIIPNKEINRIPFDLLLRSTKENTVNSFAFEDQDYVVKNYDISYAKSSMDMLSNPTPINEKLHKEKIALLSDPTKRHPSYWKSLLPEIKEIVFDESGIDVNENEEGGFKMIYFVLGFVLAFALFFFGRKKSSPS